MEEFKNWLTITRDTLAIIGIGLALWRIFIMRRTFFSDHDRSRRAKAIDLIEYWSSKLTKQSSVARKLVETFSDDQCKSLAEQKVFTVDINKKELIEKLFPQIKIDPEQNSVKINEVQATELKWEIVSYLNHLEAVLAAWRHNVADKEIIEEEFSYLYDPQKNHTALEKFRSANGLEAYLGIKEFIDHLVKKETDRMQQKGKKAIGVN